MRQSGAEDVSGFHLSNQKVELTSPRNGRGPRCGDGIHIWEMPPETSHCSSLGKGTEGSGGQGKSESGSCRLRDGSLSPETGRQYGTGWDEEEQAR